jgi:Calcium-activated chloride channel
MIKIRCPEDRLTDVAEVLRLKMKTNQGTYAPFREDTAHLFQQLNDPRDVPALYQGRMAALLRSRDRQNIIDFIIGSRIRDSGAELGPSTDLGRMVQARVPLHMRSKLECLYRPWVLFWKKDNWQSRKCLYPLPKHDEETGCKAPTDVEGTSGEVPNEKIPNFFIRLFVGAFYQPLDSIEEYFGEKVTFYFAWLQHCARHLLVLTLLGMIVTILQVASNNPDHWIRPYFSIAVMVWTFMVLLNWRRRSNLLAYSWGSIDYKDKETPRPEFHGEYVVDDITGEWVVKYPAWKRWIKYVISIPIILFFTGMAVVLMLLVQFNRDLQLATYVSQRVGPSSDPFKFELSFQNIGKPAELVKVELTREVVSDPTFWVVMGALPALLGLCIPILNFVLTKVSVILNDFENYRTESEYRTHLIIKVFGFRFVSQFGTLYYYAAISIGDEESLKNGLIRMGTSVMIYTTVAHWWSIFLQVYFFMFIRNIRRYLYRRKLLQELKDIEIKEEKITPSLSDAEARQVQLISKRMLLDQAQDDIWIELMNPAHDSFPEYITAVLQFSFVACFSVVLPITPLFCLFNFLLSMRYDAYKLCRGRRRPLAQKTGGIGIWEHLLHIVVVISVLTNCWLIAFTTSSFLSIKKDVGELGLFAIVVAWEHTMLLIKYVMQTSMSPLPRVVRDKLKREQYSREKERYQAMRTKDQGRRGKSDKNTKAALSRNLNADNSKSPGLDTMASYESIMSETGTVSA